MIENKKFNNLAIKILGKNASEEKIEQISSALKFWEKKISKEAFPIFEYIASIFNFYSLEKATTVFKELDKEFQYLSKEEVLFLPLRTKDRIESSIPLLSILTLNLSMNYNRTNLEHSGNVLKDIYTKKIVYANACKLKEGKEGTDNNLIDCPLTQSILNYAKHIKELKQQQINIKKEREKLISKLQNKTIQDNNNNIKKLTDELKRVTEDINTAKKQQNEVLNKYLLNNVLLIQVKNVIIFDDFLCTGTSVNNFITNNIEFIKQLNDVQFLFLFIEATNVGQDKVEETIEKHKLKNVEIRFGIQSINVDCEVKKQRKLDFELFKQEEERIEKLFGINESSYQCRTAIASFINAPNSNCNFLSNKGNGNWVPLFERNIHQRIDVNQEIINDTVRRYGK